MADERADQSRAGEQAYFRMPPQSWPDIWLAAEPQLRQLGGHLDAVLDDQRRTTGAVSPAELALELGATAAALFELLSPEERDLREVVTTLRTALALCWDMYSYQEAGRVTVQAHMDRLQKEIEGFEAQLEQVQAAQEEG